MDYDELECAEPIKNQVCPRCLGECWILKGRVGCWFCGGTQDSPGTSQLCPKPGLSICDGPFRVRIFH